MAMPVVNTLGPSGYPALQTFLCHIIERRNGSFAFQSKKAFAVLLAAVIIEIVEELF